MVKNNGCTHRYKDYKNTKLNVCIELHKNAMNICLLSVRLAKAVVYCSALLSEDRQPYNATAFS